MQLEKKFKVLLLIFAIAAIGHIGWSFLIGYHPFFDYFWMFPFLCIFWLAIPILIGLSIVASVELIYKRKPFIVFSVSWIVMAIVSLLYGGIDSTIAGSMTALFLANPDQVEVESRTLLESCKNDPSFCGEIADIPPAIQRLHPYSVTVTNEYTFILKFRVFDDFGGFKILAPGKVIPGIKVRDGFYWVERRFIE